MHQRIEADTKDRQMRQQHDKKTDGIEQRQNFKEISFQVY